MNCLLETKGLKKSYPGVLALNKVDFDLRTGEVHGIIGENGAGKSTFCNVLTGICSPDEGEIFFKGRKVSFDHPKQVLDLGIRMVYQERNLIPYLTGVENICLNNEPTTFGLVRNATAKTLVDSLKERFHINVDTDRPVSELNPSDQQIIEIIRAIFFEPVVLILDEPTSSLTDKDSQVLFSIIGQLKASGTGIIYISHKLEEVFSLCDRTSVFRDGMKVCTEEGRQLTRDKCITLMANREMKAIYPDVVPYATSDCLLELHNVGDDSALLRNITLKLLRGEVVGVYGLVGAGRTELGELIFGLRKMTQGKIVLDNEEISVHQSTGVRIIKGIYMLPEDRMKSGLFPTFSLMHNYSIAFIDRIRGGSGVINGSTEKKIVQDIANSPTVKLKYSSLDQSVMALSGGNKQKVLIGRMLFRDTKVIILDEPTRGIDVGTKFQIYDIIRSIAKEGRGVIFISSELPELIGVCDRIYVMKRGMISGELRREEFDQEKILSLCF